MDKIEKLNKELKEVKIKLEKSKQLNGYIPFKQFVINHYIELKTELELKIKEYENI